MSDKPSGHAYRDANGILHETPPGETPPRTALGNSSMRRAKITPEESQMIFNAITSKPKKEKKISLRITEDLGKDLDEMATLNNVSVNALIGALLESAIEETRDNYRRATFWRGLKKAGKRYADIILKVEKLLPGRYRQFTNAIAAYSEEIAPARSAWEIDGHFLQIAKELGIDTKEAEEAHRLEAVYAIMDQIEIEHFNNDKKGESE